MKILFSTLLLLLLIYSCNDPNNKNDEFWLWFTVKNDYSNEDIEQALKRIDDTGIKNILVNADVDRLRDIVQRAKKYNIDVHAWFITMNRGDIGKEHPEWLSVNRQGKSLAVQKAYVDYYKFLCPALPEVRVAIKNKIEELCEIDGLKGIHMDYIRYVDAILPIGLWSKYNLVQDKVYPEFDYGYHPFIRNKYKQLYGIDPINIKDPENDIQWNQFRYDQVTELVLQIDSLTKKYNKKLTAALFPTPKMSAKMVYQDWGKWPLDFAFPMLYHNFYNEDIEWIGEMVKEDIKTSHSKTKIIAGIFAPKLQNKGDIKNAIDISFKNGASGVCIFGLNPLSDDNRWVELKQSISKKE